MGVQNPHYMKTGYGRHMDLALEQYSIRSHSNNKNVRVCPQIQQSASFHYYPGTWPIDLQTGMPSCNSVAEEIDGWLRLTGLFNKHSIRDHHTDTMTMAHECGGSSAACAMCFV